MRTAREILDDLLPYIAELDAACPPPLPPPPPPSQTFTARVQPGEDARAAFASLFATGGVLELVAGHHPYELKLPLRGLPEWITVKGVGATLRGFTALQGHRVAFEDVGFIDPPNPYSHISLGGTKHQITQPADVPGEFIFRRVTARGPCRRGMMANCADLLVEDSDFGNYYDSNADSCAIGAWNGAFRHTIRRTRLEGASYNLAYGGSDAASEAMFPRGVLVEDCTLVKPYAWKGKGYRLKNILEFKNGFDFTVRRNLLDGCWSDVAGGGWPQGVAFIVNTANQENTNPTARVENLLIEENVVRNVGCYLQIIGRNAGPYTSGISKGIVVRRNRFETMHLEGSGHAIDIVDGPEDVEIVHNTLAENRHSLLEFSGIKAASLLKFYDNIGRHGVYGLNDANGGTLASILARLDMHHNAVQVRSGTQPQDGLPATNVYYPDITADLSQHVTSDGLPVGA